MGKLDFVWITLPFAERPIPALQTLEGKFMPLTTGFEIHWANEYLRTLTNRKIEFCNFHQYAEQVALVNADLKSA